jgi:hypothetical protein
MNYENLTERTYGKLTVIERAGTDKEGRALWRCSCECGGEKITNSHSLKRGDCKSCGCIRPNHGVRGEFVDLSGERFGKMTVIKRVKSMWLCQCECGRQCKVRTDALKSGNTKSCGCLRSPKRKLSKTQKSITYNGTTLTLSEWSKVTGKSYQTLYKRLQRGWSIDKILGGTR